MEKNNIVNGLKEAKKEVTEYIEICNGLNLNKQTEKLQQIVESVEEAIEYIEKK